MEKFTEFAKKYNLLDFLMIFLLITFLFLLSYGKIGAYLVDVGREAYLPWQMNNGEVLYKDLFNVYGPLGYQINALLFKIFGTNLNTLYCAGYFSSVLIAFLVYCITRFFVKRKTALATIFVVVSVCVFSNGLFNFIFSYSYNAVYALVGLLGSLYTALLFIKNGNKVLLNISFLFAGFSFANKIEYLPYFCFLFVLLPFLLKKNSVWCKNWQEYFLPIILFICFPVVSFGQLMLQGASFADFLNAFGLIKSVVTAPATEYFYNTYGLYANSFHFLLTLKLFLKILKYVFPFAICLYLINFIGYKYLKNNKLKLFFSIAVCAFLFLLANIWYQLVQNKSIILFCWLGLVLCFLLLAFGVFYGAKYFCHKNKSVELTQFDVCYLFLLVSSILVSFKGLVQVVLECYGTFSVAVMIVPFVVFFVHYVPKIFKFFNQSVTEQTVHNLLVVISLLFLFLNFDTFFQKMNYPVKTNTGLIFVTESKKSQQKLLNFIKNNTDKDSVLVSVPEGAIINFLTQRKGHSLYYYLIPGNIQAFGEDKIVDDFRKNPPDYFLLNTLSYNFYNVAGFVKFAPKIFDFIDKNYNQIFYVDDDLLFVLYKKKPMLK